jgi:archaellum component FlaC
MSEPDNFTLVLSRRMDEKLDRICDEMRDIKVRVTAVEGDLGGVQRRIDRIDKRLERIEKRLDLVDHS